MPDEENKGREADLEKTLRSLKNRYLIRSRMIRLFLIIGLLFVAASPIAYFRFNNPLYAGFCLLYGIPFLLAPIIRPLSELQIQIKDLENELDLLRVTVSPAEQRAEKLFKSHQYELKKYYDQTLRHSSVIFIVGIGCILIGFALVGWALSKVWSSDQSSDTTAKIVVASLGAVGGILANFIAIIYLRMYSETIKALTEFHNRLVGTHHLHYGNFLTAKIENADLREKTLNKIAESLIPK